MVYFVVRRVMFLVPVLLGMSLLTFAMAHVGPADPVQVLAGPGASRETVEALRREWGFDQPLYRQYLRHVGHALQGDLGRSLLTRARVTDEILAVFPYTVELVVASLVLALAFGIPVAVLAAARHGSAVDRVVMSVAVMGVSFPAFWIALVLIYTFSYTLGWFPVSGRGGPPWTMVGLSSIVLPALTLAGIQAGAIVRVTRSSMLDALHSEYVTTARAKGLGERLVLFKHALRNALLPVVTVAGWQIGWLLGGAVVTETVFGWPGLGQVTVSAILNRDFPLVQGAVLLGATAYVLVNLFVDVLYVFINPRASYR